MPHCTGRKSIREIIYELVSNQLDVATIFFEIHKKENKLVEPKTNEKYVYLLINFILHHLCTLLQYLGLEYQMKFDLATMFFLSKSVGLVLPICLSPYYFFFFPSVLVFACALIYFSFSNSEGQTF